MNILWLDESDESTIRLTGNTDLGVSYKINGDSEFISCSMSWVPKKLLTTKCYNGREVANLFRGSADKAKEMCESHFRNVVIPQNEFIKSIDHSKTPLIKMTKVQGCDTRLRYLKGSVDVTCPAGTYTLEFSAETIDAYGIKGPDSYVVKSPVYMPQCLISSTPTIQISVASPSRRVFLMTEEHVDWFIDNYLRTELKVDDSCNTDLNLVMDNPNHPLLINWLTSCDCAIGTTPCDVDIKFNIIRKNYEPDYQIYCTRDIHGNLWNENDPNTKILIGTSKTIDEGIARCTMYFSIPEVCEYSYH